MNDSYVYEYRLPGMADPIYVGKGVKNRCYYHLNLAKKLRQTQNRFILRLQEEWRCGIAPVITKTHIELTSAAAKEIEELLIAQHGRRGYDAEGVLLNVQRSGASWRHTEETKAKIRASAVSCVATGRMKTWTTSLTKEERAVSVTKGNKSRAKLLFAYSPEDGTFIRAFPPYNDTVELLGLKKARLTLALKDSRVECGSYLWSHHRLENLGVTRADVDARIAWSNRPKNKK